MFSKIIVWCLSILFVLFIAAAFTGGFFTVIGIIGLMTLAWLVYPEFV